MRNLAARRDQSAGRIEVCEAARSQIQYLESGPKEVNRLATHCVIEEYELMSWARKAL